MVAVTAMMDVAVVATTSAMKKIVLSVQSAAIVTNAMWKKHHARKRLHPARNVRNVVRAASARNEASARNVSNRKSVKANRCLHLLLTSTPMH
jgi:hypothetical protein